MTVSIPYAFLYRYPNEESEHTDDVLYGTDVTVKDTLNGFYRVTTSYGYEGWLKTDSVAEKLAEPNRMIVKPFADLNRSDKNFGAPVMTLPMGSLVDVAYSHQFDRHAFVVLPDKRMFYIRQDCLAPIPKALDETTARKTIVEAAKSFLGTQYRWGGRTQNGIDCSGLAFTAYQMAGITIWRDADIDKNTNMKRIDREDAKEGDLFFFDGHVAISLGGNEFIHSTSKANGVCISSFEEEPRLLETYICTGTVF